MHLMSQLGGESEGGQVGFMWEAQPWMLSKSDNSGESEQRSEKLSKSQPNSPTGPKRKKRDHNSTTTAGIMGSSSKDGGDDANSDHDHTHIERERRKKMRNMFANLHQLLPHLPPKADKSTIVDEAVNYIKSLEQTFQNLQKQKLERIQGASSSFNESSSSLIVPPQLQRIDSRQAFLVEQGENWSGMMPSNDLFPIWSSSNTILNVSGVDAHISIWSAKKPIVISNIAIIVEKHKLELISCNINSDYFKSMYMIHVRVTEAAQFQGTFTVQEICRSATNELLNLLSP